MTVNGMTARGTRVAMTGKPALEVLRRPGTWLFAVSVIYAVIQLIILDPNLFLGWDEAVYVSEVSRFHEAIFMAAHRSRGITFIVAPVVQFTDAMPPLRIYLAVVSSASLFLGFLPWCRLVGLAAPVGAALFAMNWMPLFFGTQVSPNLYSAMLCVAIIATVVRFGQESSRRTWWLLVALCAAVVFVRPLDGAAIVFAALVIAVVQARSAFWRLAAGLMGGAFVGALPWVIEAWARFGGPFQRLQRTRELVGGGLTNNFPEYLQMLDGPLVWSGAAEDIDPMAVAWLVGLFALALIGIAVGRDRRGFAGATLIGSAMCALPYMAGADVAAPRFLLPALALLCLTSGVGVGTLARAGGIRRLLGISTLVVLLALGGSWSVPVFAKQMSDHVSSGERVRVLGEALAQRSPDGNCFFLSVAGHPQISLASGCRGQRLVIDDPSANATRLEEASREGRDVYIWAPPNQVDKVTDESWNCEVIPELTRFRANDWVLCSPG